MTATAETVDDLAVAAAIGPSPVVLGLRMGFACLVVFGLLLALVFDFAHSSMRRTAARDMFDLAGLVASQVDPVAHRRLVADGGGDAAALGAQLAALQRAARAMPDVQRIYTLVRRDGAVWRVLDTDLPAGASGMRRVAMDEPHADHMLQAMRSGAPFIDTEPHMSGGAPRRGVLVPLRGLDGGEVAMLGMDVSERVFVYQSGGWVRGVYAGAIAALVLLAVLLGLFVFLQRRLLGDVVRQLREESVNDGLTGLLNRRSFGVRLEQALAYARRTDTPLALLLVDIDHFKDINDRHGHAAGDAVIVALARALRECTRGDNPVCRIGGEEYAVILPRAGVADAGAVYQRLDAALRTPLRAGELALEVSVSGGIAERLPGDERTEQLFLRADVALYRAKQDGRRRCVVAETGHGD